MNKNEQSACQEDINPEKIGAPPREVAKPDITKLPDAVVGGKFVLQPGQDLVVQYAEPWRETVLWRVVMVYDETAPTEVAQIETKDGIEKKVCVQGTTCSPGHVRLFDLQKNHYGATNYLDAAKHGIVLKVWTGKLPK